MTAAESTVFSTILSRADSLSVLRLRLLGTDGAEPLTVCLQQKMTDASS